MMIGGLTVTPALALVGAVVAVLLAIGLFRFFLRLAWRIVGIVLTLVVACGVILLILNAIKIK
jgi:hypothetical protein